MADGISKRSKRKARRRGALFAQLPSELRAMIFHFVLETGSKWDQVHLPECHRLFEKIEELDLDKKVGPSLASTEDFCPRCDNPGKGVWRDSIRLPAEVRERQRLARSRWEVARTPWPCGRSQWEPEGINPYLCMDCLHVVREQPNPAIRLFPCHCARRKDLGILLVCRSWYEQAAIVLRSHSTFAFDDTNIICQFIKGSSVQVKESLTKVSLLGYDLLQRSKEIPNRYERFESTDTFSRVWNLLPSLINLVSLELDGVFLLLRNVVYELIKLRLPSQPRVTFVLRAPRCYAIATLPESVWPHLALRVVLRGRLPELVARSMSQREQDLTKHHESCLLPVDEAFGQYVSNVERLYNYDQERKWKMFGKRIIDLDE